MHREEQKGGEVDLSLCNVHKERQGKNCKKTRSGKRRRKKHGEKKYINSRRLETNMFCVL